MCTAYISHTRMLCRVLVREMTACVKGKWSGEELEHSHRGSCDVQGMMQQLFHCLHFLKKEGKKKKKKPRKHKAQLCYFSFLKTNGLFN